MSKFKPLEYKKNIFDINYDNLKKKKIKLIVFDLDNTILEVDKDLPSEKVKSFINKLQKDFIIVIASNNVKERVRKVSEYLGCDNLYSIGKPSKKIKKFIDKRYHIAMINTAIIGDQIVTDILMGNRLSMYTILIDPIGEKDLKVTYLNSWLEKKILKMIKLKRGEYY